MSVFVLFCRPFTYLIKFYLDPKFDNVYITQHMINMDIKRSKANVPTILPLLRAERLVYLDNRKFLLNLELDAFLC